jgi:hypothetical protein
MIISHSEPSLLSLLLLISISIREREHDPLSSPSVVVAVPDGAWIRGKINGEQKQFYSKRIENWI